MSVLLHNSYSNTMFVIHRGCRGAREGWDKCYYWF